MGEQRRARLGYARALLRQRRFGELLRRGAAALRLAIATRLSCLPRAYRRHLAALHAIAPPPASLTSVDAAARPLCSLLLVGADAPPAELTATLRSLCRQSYGAWEALVAAPRPDGAAHDARIRYLPGIALAALAAAARGEFVALLWAGDTLLPQALAAALHALLPQPTAGLLYSDEGLLADDGQPLRPRYKPAFDAELLLSWPYTGQLTLWRRALLDAAGGIDPALKADAALYDLTLRLSERSAVLHLPALLYQRRLRPGDGSDDALAAQRGAVVRAALQRRGVAATVAPGPHLPAGGPTVAVRRSLAARPQVAIVIPFRNQAALLRRCIDSIRTRSRYSNYSLLPIDNGSDDPETLEYIAALSRHGPLLRFPAPFNFAAINNFAAAHTEAEQLLLLNNDTEVICPDWIEALLEHASRPEVGIVGARLHYPDGALQHAGVVVGLYGLAGHPFDGWPEGGAGVQQACGHGGEVLLARQVSAVTAACAMIRRQLYLAIGGMDAARFPVVYNDVDLCLRLRSRGLQVVYTPHCQLIHHTSQSRELRSDLQADDNLLALWGPALLHDPFYNPHLSLRFAYRPRFCETLAPLPVGGASNAPAAGRAR